MIVDVYEVEPGALRRTCWTFDVDTPYGRGNLIVRLSHYGVETRPTKRHKFRPEDPKRTYDASYWGSTSYHIASGDPPQGDPPPAVWAQLKAVLTSGMVYKGPMSGPGVNRYG